MALVRLENVTLDYPVSVSKAQKGHLASQSKAVGGQLAAGGAGYMRVRALEDLSLSLEPGDRLALIGHNGAGKSTLLRVMAGLYTPTQGRVVIQGRVAPLLNLSFGLDMEATGFDNIIVRGLFLGMSRAEIKRKYDSIAEFSELGEFLHLPNAYLFVRDARASCLCNFHPCGYRYSALGRGCRHRRCRLHPEGEPAPGGLYGSVEDLCSGVPLKQGIAGTLQ
jgi:hypothetical protein